jgi:prevent-host-death family protein
MMKTITAKELKNRTGDALKTIARGEKIMVTYRGKPFAVFSPASEESTFKGEPLRPFTEAWRDIEGTLRKNKAVFPGWQEATAWSRKRK